MDLNLKQSVKKYILCVCTYEHVCYEDCKMQAGVVAHTFNISDQETETGRYPQGLGQPGLNSKFQDIQSYIIETLSHVRDTVTLPGTWKAFSSGDQITVSFGLWVQSTYLGMKGVVSTVQEKGLESNSFVQPESQW